MNEHQGDDAPRPRVGISSCLLGEPVRYDAGHKRNRFLADTLSRFVDFLPRCPEMAIGLGAPREPIHLVRSGTGLTAQGVHSGEDVGNRIRNYGQEQGRELGELCGYVFKSRSPSCGLARVPVYGAKGPIRGISQSGLYAEQIRCALPWLPVEDEGRLNDSRLRENFLIRIFTLHRFRQALSSGFSARALVEFHTAHKYLLLAHGVGGYRSLGRLVATAGNTPEQVLVPKYREGLMAALQRPAPVSGHVNVLQHLLGHLRGRIDNTDRAELVREIEGFREGRLPWAAIRLLVCHHLRRNPDPFASRQVYLAPYPDALDAAER